MTHRLTAIVTLAACLALLTACASAAPTPAPTVSPTPTPTADPLAGMTLEQRVGQLFIVGSPATGAGPEAVDALRTRFAGGCSSPGARCSGWRRREPSSTS